MATQPLNDNLVFALAVGSAAYLVGKQLFGSPDDCEDVTNRRDDFLVSFFFPEKHDKSPCQNVIDYALENLSTNAVCLSTKCSSERCNLLKTACKRSPRCPHLHGLATEPFESSFLQMFMQLYNAKQTVDLCIYLFTAPNLAKCITALKRRNVKIRIITDAAEFEGDRSKIREMLDMDIPVKANNKDSSLMHHKFFIVDGKKIVTGSFNWTTSASTKNHESIIITNHKNVVDSYIKQFDFMWTQFTDYIPPHKSRRTLAYDDQ